MIPVIGFVVVALAAIAFVAVPVWRRTQSKGRAILLAALAVLMLGVGGGTYWMLGRPALAVRATKGLDPKDARTLVPALIARARKAPNDPQAWTYLGEVYMTLRDPADAAKAYARAITLVGKGNAELDIAYGEATVAASGGGVTQEAEEAFTAALGLDEHNVPARFYLGLARAQRNDRTAAIALWQNLLADIPTTAPLHQMLVDRIALLTAQGSGGAPNPQAMVAMLAARLKADPNDALGWVRLVRAYHVLGEDDKARAALATARKTFAGNADAQIAFDTAAKDLK